MSYEDKMEPPEPATIDDLVDEEESRAASVKKPPPPIGTLGQPRYPSSGVAQSAIVPKPPQLPDGLEDVEAARWLLNAYRGAMERRYGQPCGVLLKRGQLEKSQHLPALVEAAGKLRELGAAPAAWAAWSVDVWEEYGDGNGKPPLKWVFGTKRMEERAGWFEAEASDYSKRRAVMNEVKRHLLERYQGMRAQIVAEGAQTEGEVKPIVERWFPGDAYLQLVEGARKRALEDQERINAAVARGEWVWR
jgi:hypothetical protein